MCWIDYARNACLPSRFRPFTPLIASVRPLAHSFRSRLCHAVTIPFLSPHCTFCRAPMGTSLDPCHIPCRTLCTSHCTLVAPMHTSFVLLLQHFHTVIASMSNCHHTLIMLLTYARTCLLHYLLSPICLLPCHTFCLLLLLHLRQIHVIAHVEAVACVCPVRVIHTCLHALGIDSLLLCAHDHTQLLCCTAAHQQQIK